VQAFLQKLARRLALLSAGLAPLDVADEQMLLALAAEEEPEVREVFGSQLRAVLERALPLERTYLIASWATSDDERVRLAMAEALAGPVDAVGVRTALEVLAGDASAVVRQAAETARARRGI
jgi:hypothetical protein